MNNRNFKEELNAEIQWELFGTGPEMVNAFKSGRLHIGYMGLTPAIIGIANNVPIKCIAGGHIEGTIMIANKNFIKLEDLANDLQRTFNQFKGKKVGVPSRGSIHDVILNHYLDEFGLLNDIGIKNYSQAEFIATDMAKNLIEAGVGTPSLAVFTSTILDSHIIIPPEYLWPYNPSYGIFAHENYINKYPELIEIFLLNHKKASYMLREKQDEAASLISKTIEIANQKFIKSVLEISPKYCIALSKEYIKTTMEFVDALYHLKYIKERLDPKDIFNLDFVKKLHPEADHYK